MKVWLDNYFGFTKRAYNGLIVLITILFIVSIIPFGYEIYFNSVEPITSTDNAALLELKIVNKTQNNKDLKSRSQAKNYQPTPTAELFKFDPNQINVQQWQKLGLSEKQALSIINYRNKGGKFFKSEDLKKMYTISSEKYEQLMPYISIENLNPNHIKTVYSEKSTFFKKEKVMVELNSADTLLLTEISGIGPAFAKRIAKYREKLGGFYFKEQLMEVYGIDSAKYNEIKDQIKINTASIKKININTAEFDELKNHPYLKYKQINAIIQYRKQHGKYKAMEDLKKVIILTPQIIQNLAPYLSL